MRKLKKYITLSVLTVSVISILTSYKANVEKDEEPKWMNFMWISDSLNNQYFDKTRIYLPVQIQDIPHHFTLQFDLGANVSLVYEPSIRPYLILYPIVGQKLDTVSKFHSINHVDLVIDGYTFKDRSVFLREDYRNVLNVDSVNSNTVKHIGTIGADLFQGKVLIIDYPNTRIAVTEKVPSSMAKSAAFVDISLDKRGRPVLPLKIKGKERKVLFDTGSSLFSIITTPENWATVISQQVTDTLSVPAWGRKVHLYGSMGDNVYLGNQKLPKAMFYKSEQQTGFITENDIWGITGNAYFWNKTIIIDFANKKFGVIE